MDARMPLYKAVSNMLRIGHLTDITVDQVKESRQLYSQIVAALQTYHVVLDCLVAKHFGVKRAEAIVAEANSFDMEVECDCIRGGIFTESECPPCSSGWINPN